MREGLPGGGVAPAPHSQRQLAYQGNACLADLPVPERFSIEKKIICYFTRFVAGDRKILRIQTPSSTLW